MLKPWMLCRHFLMIWSISWGPTPISKGSWGTVSASCFVSVPLQKTGHHCHSFASSYHLGIEEWCDQICLSDVTRATHVVTTLHFVYHLIVGCSKFLFNRDELAVVICQIHLCEVSEKVGSWSCCSQLNWFANRSYLLYRSADFRHTWLLHACFCFLNSLKDVVSVFHPAYQALSFHINLITVSGK